MAKSSKMIILAWLLVLFYYFYQYALRSAPSVMIPQLSEVLNKAIKRSQEVAARKVQSMSGGLSGLLGK